MQTSGQFGVVPPSEVPPQYNSVNNTANNNSNNTSNRTISTPGSTQALGHMLFNLSNPSLSSPTPYNPHSSSAPVFLSKAGLRDGAAELFQDAAATHQQQQQQRQQQQQQQSHQFSQFLQASSASTEHYENVPQDATMQQKQGNSTAAARAHVVQAQAQTHAQVADQARQESVQAQKIAQSMHLHNQLSLGLDQSMSEGKMPSPSTKDNLESMKVSDNQLNSTDPISLGDIDQAEEGAGAGNRWPRQETLALLKIRADMDAAFRDTSVKRPLWDEVSRKLGELGYERSAKKCKEKFENVNKYYKRTKDGKVGRQDGKNYRFFTQLEALQQSNTTTTTTNTTTTNNIISSLITPPDTNMLIPSSIPTPISTDNISHFKSSASNPPDSSLILPGGLPPSAPTPVDTPSVSTFLLAASTPPAPPPSSINPAVLRPPLFAENAAAALNLSSQSSSDNDEDDDDEDDNDVDDDDDVDDEVYDGPRPRSDLSAAQPLESKKRKRKTSTSMMAFFEGLLKKVIDKQEQMHEKFLQALERRESDRMIREEAWRRQEMARLSKEHDLRVQERSSAAARDAALIAFLQKVTGQNVDLPPMTSTSVPIAAQPVQSAPPLHQDNAMQYEDQDASDPNSKRWLKPEVLALIDLHSNLQAKFTEAGPKGPLWEEIANGMAKLGYSSRTAKRCKEKWENINKYFKRAKESNKKRPENAKTCPYFHELDALYRKGSMAGASNSNLALPYRPSIVHTHPQEDQPSTSNREGDCAHILQTQLAIAPSDRATLASASTTASITSNPSAAGAGDANNSNTVGDPPMRNVNNNGGLQSKGSVQLSMDMFGGAAGLNASNTSDHIANSARSGFSAELGLNLQQQSACMELPQKQVIQGEFGKIIARGEHAQADIPSQSSRESKPSLAPMPNSSSFMANMLQNLNGSSNAGNNNCTNQD